MNIKSIIFFFIIIFALQLVYANPASIQRYTWVGGNENGTIVALMLSHFGPASQAPFAKLIVKQADKAEPLFVDTAMYMSGGENDLSELCLYLLNKNTEQLKNFGIALSKDFLTEANAITLPNHDSNISSGWIDIENIGINEFTIKSYKSDSCPATSNAIAIDIKLNGKKRLTVNPAPDECWNDKCLLRNIYRTKKVLWFIMSMHAYGLAKVDTYWIDVQGITF